MKSVSTLTNWDAVHYSFRYFHFLYELRGQYFNKKLHFKPYYLKRLYFYYK